MSLRALFAKQHLHSLAPTARAGVRVVQVSSVTQAILRLTETWRLLPVDSQRHKKANEITRLPAQARAVRDRWVVELSALMVTKRIS